MSKFDKVIESILNPDTTHIMGEGFSGSDVEYMAAVKSGDMDLAQSMVESAAKRAGYDETWYHGTRRDFDEFKLGDLGIHVGSIEQANYKDPSKVLKVFVNRGIDLEIDEDAGYWMGSDARETFIRAGFDRSEIESWWEEARHSKTTHEKAVILSSKLKEAGADSISYPNQYEGGGESLILRSPNQIKSADPETYDSGGQVIPLSERFN